MNCFAATHAQNSKHPRSNCPLLSLFNNLVSGRHRAMEGALLAIEPLCLPIQRGKSCKRRM